MIKKYSRFGFSIAVMVFSVATIAEPEVYGRPAIVEDDDSGLRNKYHRAVLFGDSQLDTNNIGRFISGRIVFDLGWLNPGFDMGAELPLGAPFTSGKGNTAQQLFGSDFFSANPMYYSDTFRPSSFVHVNVLLHSQSYNGETVIDNSKNTNMAQGGSKILDVFPGGNKEILTSLVAGAIASSSYSWLSGMVPGIISQMDQRNFDLLKPISDQPKIFLERGGRFNENDLALVLAGGNDVIAQGYDRAKNISDAKKDIGGGREKLIYDIAKQGAKNIFFGNIPDIRVVPEIINWKPGSTNVLHSGVAKEKNDALLSMTELMLGLNEKTTSSALSVTQKSPGTTITIFDLFKFMQHVAADRERYGIVNDISVSCADVQICNENRAMEGGKYFTEDGLHPSEKTSEIIANAYKHYLRDTRQPLMSRLSNKAFEYDAFFDAFADIVVTQEGSELTHNIVGGVLDLSLKSQVDNLTPKIVLNGALLRFDDSTEKNQETQYAHQMDKDIVIKDRFSGIEVANASSEFVYSGNAHGSALLKSGFGTLVLTGANDLNIDPGKFGTTIVSGILQVGNGADVGSLNSNVFINESSSLAFNHSVDHSFAGNVRGTGSLLKKGVGVLTLTGDSQHSGGTVIRSGTLQIGDGGDQGWLLGNVVNDAVMMFNRRDNIQFDGRIDGSGSIVKAGGGSLNLTGSGGITGQTEVRSGNLGFNGVFDATNVRVFKDALVYGAGAVRSLSLEAGGIISPGNSIGTFNVVKDLVFNKSSIYAVEANAAGLSDMIKVGGVADVKGGDVLVAAELGEYSPVNKYTVLSAGGGVSGRFDSVSANFAFLDPSLSYDISEVSLMLARNDVKPVDLCQGANQKAVCSELLPVDPVVDPGVVVTPVDPVVDPGVVVTPVDPVVDPGVAVTPVDPVVDPGVVVTPVDPVVDPGVVVTPVDPVVDPGVAVTPVDPVVDPGVVVTPVDPVVDPGVVVTPVDPVVDPGVAVTPVDPVVDPGVVVTPVDPVVDPGVVVTPVDPVVDPGVVVTPVDPVVDPGVVVTPVDPVVDPGVVVTPVDPVVDPGVVVTPVDPVVDPGVVVTPVDPVVDPGVVVTPVDPVVDPGVVVTPVDPVVDPGVVVTPVDPVVDPGVVVTPVDPVVDPGVVVTPVDPVVDLGVVVTPVDPVVDPGVVVTPVDPVVDPGVVVTPVDPVVIGGKNSSLLAKENAVVVGMSKSEFTQFANLITGDVHPTLKTVLVQESSYIRDSVSKRLYETEEGLAGSGAWGHVFGLEGRQEGGRNISSLSRNIQGFILGSDIWVEDSNLSLGVFGGYRKTSMSQGISSADIGTYNLGAYGSKRYDALSVRLGASFSWHDIETKRKIYYKANASTPNADYHGNTVQLFSELAYDLRLDRFNVEPFVGLSYARVEVSGFSEDKDLFSLSGKRETKDVYAGTLGARINYSTHYNDDIKLSFQGGAGLKHAFSDVSSNTDMALRSGGNDFRINGLPLKKNVAQLNAKVVVQTRGGFSVGLDYMAEGANGMRDQSISAFGSWEF